MRTKERLIFILENMNRPVIGWKTDEVFLSVAKVLNQKHVAFDEQRFLHRKLFDIVTDHDSPYVRRLASEAGYYLVHMKVTA